MSRAHHLLRQIANTAIVLLVLLGTIMTLGISLSYLINPDQFVEFFGERDPAGVRRPLVLLHICGGMAALILGALQFWARLQFRHPGWHRAIGWGYATAVLGGAAGALLIAPFSFGPLANAAGFSALGALWAGSTVIALQQARSRQFARHRNWMIMSFGLTMAAVSLRLQLLVFQSAFGLSFEQAYRIVAWSCWLPNLAITMFIIRKKARSEYAEGDAGREGPNQDQDQVARTTTATDIG